MIIKVCGLREPENIRAVENIDGIDFQGFIFYPLSPRRMNDSPEITDTVRRCRKKKVGVFVDETIEKILQNAQLYRFDYLQLHGEESPLACSLLRSEGYGIIKSFSVGSTADFENASNYRDSVDYLLFDTKNAGYGGSGKRFDWSLLNGYDADIPFLLSGGITPDCVQELRLFAHPQFAGIDLNSGFEFSPGIKNVKKIKEFVSNFINTDLQ